VEDAPEFPALWPEVAALLRGRVVFAHNAAFDMGVLGATLDRYGLREEPFRFGCTARLARRVWDGLPNHRLDTVAGALGFSFRHHNALDDARACAFLVRKALERSGTDDIEAMMRTHRQRLHVFKVARTQQDFGLCGELL
jgi:DNA polymerase-3 subunit epsilon